MNESLDAANTTARNTATVEAKSALEVPANSAAKVDVRISEKVVASSAAKMEVKSALEVPTNSAAKVDIRSDAKMVANSAANVEVKSTPRVTADSAAKVDVSTAAKVVANCAAKVEAVGFSRVVARSGAVCVLSLFTLALGVATVVNTDVGASWSGLDSGMRAKWSDFGGNVDSGLATVSGGVRSFSNGVGASLVDGGLHARLRAGPVCWSQQRCARACKGTRISSSGCVVAGEHSRCQGPRHRVCRR